MADYTDGTVPLTSRPSAAFITSRGYALPTTPDEMAASPWFNLWERRLWAYRELEPGDTLYWYDATEQAVLWKSRVSRVEKFEYESKAAVHQRLREVFNDPALTHPYLDKAADHGYCLAFKVDHVRQLRVPKPAGHPFPRDGWLRLDDEAAQEWLLRLRPRLDPDGRSAANLARAVAEAAEGGHFSPVSAQDERKRTLREIVERRGQPEFRHRLIAAYGGCCAVTGCDAVAALEAAHIAPYSGPSSQHVTNGLLLRADIHTLFDLDLIGFDPNTLTVALSPAIRGTTYDALDGLALALPANPAERPSREALAGRWQRFKDEGIELDCSTANG